jgi:hypothetical protein
MPENNLTNVFQGTVANQVITYEANLMMDTINEAVRNAIYQPIGTTNPEPVDTTGPAGISISTESYHPLFTRGMVEAALVIPAPEELDCYKAIYSEKEFEDEILFSKDGKQVGKLTIDNTKITFEGDADESALQFFNSLRHVNGTYIRKLHKALEAYRDIPVNGEYMAEYALQMINNPYPLEIEKRLCL